MAVSKQLSAGFAQKHEQQSSAGDKEKGGLFLRRKAVLISAYYAEEKYVYP